MADELTPSQQIKAESGASIQNAQQIIGDVHEHHHHYLDGSTAQALDRSLPPKEYHHLIGRSQEQDTILNVLRAPNKRPIPVIVGLGGMGKTALAREVAERCRQEQLFDHLVWGTAKKRAFRGGTYCQGG